MTYAHRTMTRLLTAAVILLFFGLSTNAYACLFPLYGTPDMVMEAGCPSADEPSPREFGDLFKFAVPAHSSHPQIHALQMALSILEIDSFTLFHSMVESNRDSGYFADKTSQNILLKTTILRI